MYSCYYFGVVGMCVYIFFPLCITVWDKTSRQNSLEKLYFYGIEIILNQI